MNRFARAFKSVLLLAAAWLSAGCASTSEGAFNPDQYWEDQARESD